MGDSGVATSCAGDLVSLTSLPLALPSAEDRLHDYERRRVAFPADGGAAVPAGESLTGCPPLAHDTRTGQP